MQSAQFVRDLVYHIWHNRTLFLRDQMHHIWYTTNFLHFHRFWITCYFKSFPMLFQCIAMLSKRKFPSRYKISSSRHWRVKEESVQVQPCLTSTETIRTIRRDSHLDFHTDPELWWERSETAIMYVLIPDFLYRTNWAHSAPFTDWPTRHRLSLKSPRYRSL